MCCTLYESTLSNTILYAADTELDGRRVHVMAYQNRAANLASGPNAMLLPIPSALALSAENTLDARLFKGILSDYVATYDALRPKARPVIKEPIMFSGPDVPEVFDSGSYTVVLAKDARMIPAALARVPEERRPSPNRAILQAYAKFYPGWHIALCCYDGAIEAEPMVFWYEPMNPDRLFVPAVDAHDGHPPEMNKKVLRDHYVFFAAQRARRGMKLQKRKNLDSIPKRYRSLFVDHFAGVKIDSPGWNGDFYIDVRDLETDNVGLETLPPPGAEN